MQARTDMSPDPPRDNNSDDNEFSNGGPYNFLVLNEEDVGEGDHELDFSSHESEMTSDDDDEDVQNADEAAATVGNTRVRARAHYQMLIPFPTTSDTAGQGIQEFHAEENDTDDDDDTEILHSAPNPDPDQHIAIDSDETKEEVTHENTAKREINLSSENVDTIKDVMKNFTLPSTCIPSWAKEISEDVWKSKLISKIGDETQPVENSTKKSLNNADVPSKDNS